MSIRSEWSLMSIRSEWSWRSRNYLHMDMPTIFNSYIAVPLTATVRNYSFLDISDRETAHIINLWLNNKLRAHEFLWIINLQLDCCM